MTTKILIIEDNEVNLELMSYLLGLKKYTILEESDGENGLKAALEFIPDLIICDIQLPEMDGYQIVRRLRMNPLTSGIPLLAVTALSMTGDRERILSWGFDGYLSKPITPTEFVAQVEAYLPASKRLGISQLSNSSISLDAVIGANESILVVDNLQMNLDLLNSLLSGLRYRVSTALSVDDAFGKLHERLPDLIISDVMMQGGTGFDFLSLLKQSDIYSLIPFIFLTSTAITGKERNLALELGANLYLTRPIDNYKLAQHIRSCLTGEH